MSNFLIPVIITTEYRGVFFGKILKEDFEKTTIKVQDCRNVRYWSSETNGFQGLSSIGPNKDCIISAKAGGEVVLHKVTSVTTCSPEAIVKWDKLI